MSQRFVSFRLGVSITDQLVPDPLVAHAISCPVLRLAPVKFESMRAELYHDQPLGSMYYLGV